MSRRTLTTPRDRCRIRRTETDPIGQLPNKMRSDMAGHLTIAADHPNAFHAACNVHLASALPIRSSGLLSDTRIPGQAGTSADRLNSLVNDRGLTGGCSNLENSELSALPVYRGSRVEALQESPRTEEPESSVVEAIHSCSPVRTVPCHRWQPEALVVAVAKRIQVALIKEQYAGYNVFDEGSIFVCNRVSSATHSSR